MHPARHLTTQKSRTGHTHRHGKTPPYSNKINTSRRLISKPAKTTHEIRKRECDNTACYKQQHNKQLRPSPSMLQTLREKASRLAGILPALPHFCALCAQVSPQSLCPACLDRYFTRISTRCRICAENLTGTEHDQLCGACLKKQPAFDRIVTAADYAPPIDQLVQSLKFGSRLALAPLFANLIAKAVSQAENLPPPNILAPVPLAAKRLAERGFNQALEIARPLSRQLRIPLVPTLITRIRETAPQSLTTLAERRKNIRQAFAVCEPLSSRLQGRHIAIVDDVLTTGQTMGEIARILKQAGAASVSGFVFARTSL